MRDLQQLLPIIRFFDDIYQKNSMPSDRYYNLCQKFAQYTRLCVIIGHSYFFVMGVIIGFSGTVDTFTTGIYQPSMYMYLPYVHEHTIWTNILMTIHNAGASTFCVVNIAFSDVLFYVIFTNFPLIPRVFAGQLEEFEQALLTEGTTIRDVRYRFLQCILMQNKFNEWVWLWMKCGWNVLFWRLNSGETLLSSLFAGTPSYWTNAFSNISFWFMSRAPCSVYSPFMSR